ncbi:MAG: S8 family serine peptidase [Myxococcota bacterium]|nr:S8 family serine peptidase [Myxococcota bacterium]
MAPSLRSRLAVANDLDEIGFSVVVRDDVTQRRRVSGSQRRKRVRARTDAVLSAVPESRHRVRVLENVAGFSGKGNRATIEALADHPSVERVYLDLALYPLMAEGVPLTGADQAAVLGVTGSGINVAVVDSGVMSSHADLAGNIVSEACFCADSSGTGCCPNGNSTMTGAGAAVDMNGHGTNVTGIITSTGILTAPGVAPDAGIVAIKVYGADSSTLTNSSVDAALDWLLSEHASLGVRVINISLGTATTYSNEFAFPCTGALTASLVSDLAAVGVSTFIGSGNGAVNDGLSFPACIPEAISVGGVYDANVGGVGWTACTDLATAPDRWVCHTNSSLSLDLLAPDWRTRTTALGGGVSSMGGTSAASPYAAGLAALLLEQDPSRTPSQVQSLLISGAPMVTNPESGLSFPRADVSDQFPVCGDGELSGTEECDDGNAVSGDCCSSSCTFEAATSPCDDGDSCTVDEVCDGAGQCGSGSAVVCDDGLFCNGAEICDAALGCQVGTPPLLDDGVSCTQDACDEVADAVLHTPDAASCDNGLYCDGAEVCDAVLDCQVGTPPLLDDGVSCTQDACDEVADAVLHTPDATSCDNGLYCDGAEVCDAVLGCQSGDPLIADDGIACTVDTCDEGAGGALHTPDDVYCDDGDPCTADLCDEDLGCLNETIPACATAVPTGGVWTRGMLAWAFVVTGVLWGSGWRGMRGFYARRRGRLR